MCFEKERFHCPWKMNILSWIPSQLAEHAFFVYEMTLVWTLCWASEMPVNYRSALGIGSLQVFPPLLPKKSLAPKSFTTGLSTPGTSPSSTPPVSPAMLTQARLLIIPPTDGRSTVYKLLWNRRLEGTCNPNLSTNCCRYIPPPNPFLD